MKKHGICAVCLLLTLLLALAGCQVVNGLFNPAALTPTPLPTLTATAASTPKPTEEPCAFVWANQEVPALSLQLGAHFKQLKLPFTSVRASAFGENCITASGVNRGFGAMYTDLYVNLTLTDLNDRAAAGALIEQVMAALKTFPGDAEVMGNGWGYLGLNFSDGRSDFNFWRRMPEVQAALDKGLKGEALMDELMPK
ncbi:MAG TPA: hypothetical protein PKW33_20580 [Anaerolineaceae bacterium]|nr:hypothetical protein [Anaerolineaceae bacterium]HPN54004.1 hypothetical protein [Anaerolineaceae bacterium]